MGKKWQKPLNGYTSSAAKNIDHDPSSFKFWGGYLCSSRKGGHRRPKTSRTAKNQRNRAKEKGKKLCFSVFPALLCPIPLVFSRLFPKGRHESAAFVRMPPCALRFETHERKKRIGICRPICIRLHTSITMKICTKKDTITPNNQYEILLIRKFIVSFYCNWESDSQNCCFQHEAGRDVKPQFFEIWRFQSRFD